MQIWKKIILLSLTLTLLFTNLIYASDITALTDSGETISINVVPDTTAGTVVICGRLPVNAETNFFLLILKDSSVSLGSITNENFLTNVDFFIQSTTDQQGSFSVTCLPLTTWNENEHIVYVAYTQKQSQVFLFPTETIENTIITTIATASADTVGKLLSGEILINDKPLNNYLGLDLTLYHQLNNKTPVHASVAGQTFPNVTTIINTLKSAIEQRAEEEISEREDASFLQSIKDASEAELIAIIEANDPRLALDLSGSYGYTYLKFLYNSGDKAPLQFVLSKLRAISSLTEARTVFGDSVILSSVNTADWQTVDDVLTAYQTELNLTDLSRLNQLSDAKRTNLLREFVLINFTDKSSVKSQLTTLITKYSRPQENIGGGGGGGVSVVAPIPTPEATEPIKFSDVSNAHWASPAINDLTGKGVLSGYPDGSFQPDKSVSREEFVKILVLAMGLYNENSQCAFIDVTENSWYYPYVASAYENGIVNGKGDYFGSGEQITREEAATMIYRCTKILGKNLSGSMEFVDNDMISGFAKEAVTTISGTIINGDENGRFNPFGSTTRAQSAKMIYQLLQLN